MLGNSMSLNQTMTLLLSLNTNLITIMEDVRWINSEQRDQDIILKIKDPRIMPMVIIRLVPIIMKTGELVRKIIISGALPAVREVLRTPLIKIHRINCPNHLVQIVENQIIGARIATSH